MRNPCSEEIVVAVETPQDIEHQDLVAHRAVVVMKSINHALHLPAVFANGEVPLLKVAERRVELKSVGLGDAKELALECQPGLARGTAVSPNDVLEL